MSDVVYDLWYVRSYETREDTELQIGIYRTESDAQAAILRLKDQAGFREFPAGFEIYPTTLNRDGWTDGFFSSAYDGEKGSAVEIDAGVKARNGKCLCGRKVAKFSE